MAQKIFRIAGRVIDRKTKQGVAGVRVDAMDKELIVKTPLGSASTDPQGAFAIEIEKGPIKELFGDRNIVLFFKVFRDAELLASTEDSVVWDRDQPDQEITIKLRLASVEPPTPPVEPPQPPVEPPRPPVEPPRPPVQPPKPPAEPPRPTVQPPKPPVQPPKPFVVRGQVQQATGDARANVRLFRSGPGQDTMLGEARTDSNGRFEVKYNPDAIKPGPDVRLVVGVFDNDGNLLVASPSFTASDQEPVNITVSGEPVLCRLVGQVTKDDNAVPNRNVQLWGFSPTKEQLLKQATTNADGFYLFEFDPGDFKVDALESAVIYIRVIDDDGSPKESPRFLAWPGEQQVDLKITTTSVQPDQFIVEGHVYFQNTNNVPAPGRIVRAFNIAASPATRLGNDAQSDSDGSYKITYSSPQTASVSVAIRVFNKADVQVGSAPAFPAQKTVHLDLFVLADADDGDGDGDEGNAISHQVFGRLVVKGTTNPLSGYIVHGLDLEAVPPTKDLGYDFSNGQGVFTLFFTTLRAPAGGSNTVSTRNIRLVISDPSGKELPHKPNDPPHIFSVDTGQVLDVPVEVQPGPQPATHPLSSFNLPSGLLPFLSGQGITSLEDIRKKGGLSGIALPANLANAPVKAAMRFLDAQADLGRVSSDITLNTNLINNGFNSVFDIANAPRTQFVALAQPNLGDFGSAQTHFVARAQENFLSSVATGIRADLSNGLDGDDFGLGGSVLPVTCGCEDCHAAVSPMAYLADLLKYCLGHVENAAGVGSTPQLISMDFLVKTFNQPFSSLPASCESVATQVRQLRILVEVLNKYLGPKVSSTAIETAERDCLIAGYTTLLNKLGTSFEELRLARNASNDKRLALADRLGIDVARLSDLTPDLSAAIGPFSALIKTRFGLVGVSRDPLRSDESAELQTWRLERLRASWVSEDFPDDTPGREQSIIDPSVTTPPDFIGQLRPIIDPDIIGPDDFRHPFAKTHAGDPDRPFDLWLKRRAWVDAQIQSFSSTRKTVSGQQVPDLDAMFRAMNQFVSYGTKRFVAWVIGQPSIVDGLADKLATGVDIKQTRIDIQNALKLPTESFTRLMAIRGKDTQASSDARNPKVEDDEWREVYSILAQARKSKLYAEWRAEELDLSILLGPEEFWISLREPAEGDWPPVVLPQRPLIDPDALKVEDLPEPTAGEPAILFWQARRKRLEDIKASLKAEREGQGFDAMFHLALGHLEAADTLDHYLTTLNDDLNNADATIAEGAKTRITSDLHLTIEGFNRLMLIRAEDKETDPLKAPTAAEYAEVYAILTRAQKEKTEFSQWISEESHPPTNGNYWNLLKARVPRWRASSEARANWQQALRIRGNAPIIDPDLIGPDEISKEPSHAASVLWEARRTEVDGNRDSIKGALANNPTAFNSVVETTLGVPVEENPLRPIISLAGLSKARQQGQQIDKNLAQLYLANDAFLLLLRVHDLILKGASLLQSEWESVYSILAQVKKRQKFAAWRAEETANQITLSPDYFRPPAVDTTVFPPPPPVQLTEWLATAEARRAWEDTLQARTGQRDAVIAGVREAISATEEATLPGLRDALIMIPGAADGGGLEARAKWLSDRLLIDTQQSGCRKTTRVAQAIETLQLLLSSLRAGLLKPYPNLSLDPDRFDEEWEWLGSYATWRAAVFVFLYPENVLMPNLRQRQTPGFRELVTSLRSNSRLTPEQACSLARNYSDYLQDVCTLILEASCHAFTRVREGDCRSRSSTSDRRLFYVFGRGGKTKTVYWSAVDPEDASGHAQTFWKPLPGLKDVVNIIGASVYEKAPDQRSIYLFAITEEKGKKKLGFIKYDLLNQVWSEEPEPLELPKEKDQEATDFTAVVKQSSSISTPPHLTIRLSNGALYMREMNDDASDWADGDWHLLVGSQLYRSFNRLCAMVAINSDEFYLLVEDKAGKVRYRFFGESPVLPAAEDGYWESLPAGSFTGSFSWTNSPPDVFVYLENGPFSRSTLISRSFLVQKTVKGIRDFEDWLKAVPGVSLTQYVIKDNTLFNSMTLFRLLTLPPGHAGTQPTDSQKETYIHDITEHLMNTEEGKEWKLADEMVRRFALSGDPAKELSLEQVLLSSLTNTAIDFKRRFLKPGITASGITGLDKVVPNAGVESSKPNLWAHSVKRGQVGLYRTTFLRGSGAALTENMRVRLSPFATGPFEIAERFSAETLQERRYSIGAVFGDNLDGAQSNLDYLEEAHYFVPFQLALKLQSRGQYTAALDLFRGVYDYTRPTGERKIYPGLWLEESLDTTFRRAEDWLLDPLNPHAIAATRRNAYTRYTILSIIRCFVEFADAEFTRDTTESVARARALYMTALDLLDTPELKQSTARCSDVIGSLDIQVPDAQRVSEWNRIKNALGEINDPAVLLATVTSVRSAMTNRTTPLPQRLQDARDAVRNATTPSTPANLGAVVTNAPSTAAQINLRLLAQPDISNTVGRIGNRAGQDFSTGVRLVTGQSFDQLQLQPPLPWLGQAIVFPAAPGSRAAVTAGSGNVFGGFFRSGSPPINPAAPSFTQITSQFTNAVPFVTLQNTMEFPDTFIPALSVSFCIPQNPILSALRLRAQLNLYKLRNCRNIAGIERELDPYAAPTDTVSGLASIGGGQLVLPGLNTLAPTAYRYSTLIERAKQLVNLAQQIEGSMLSALEKRDAEFYNLMKARQDVRLARAGVRLQDLRVKEAEDGVRLADLQQERSQIQFDHYSKLLEEGQSGLEDAALGLLLFAAGLQAAAGFADFSAGSLKAPDVARALSSFGAAASTTATFFSTWASYARRAQDWELQKSLAQQDVKIGAQQIRLADDHVRVAGQERVIAQTQVDNSEAIADFLTTKFTNVELYDWMSDVLERVYSFFLQQATSMAQVAAAQLAFERQEVPPPFIQADYWEAPTDGGTASAIDGRAPDRRGLTGSARLLQDIFQLDQHAFETNRRKLQLTKSISLARMSPAEFQRLRETGVMRFNTMMEMFDRDFPGHYLRLIRKVRTSVIALVPAVSGIRATLSSVGPSRVVIGGPTFQKVEVRRNPETVALSSPRDATGLFELDQQPELLLPFEGTGVETGWEFRMPKASNLFDYSTIADVILTIEYTALNSFDYRQQVIQSLNPKLSSDMPFSFRNQFADQWYDLNNPDQAATPMVVQFSTTREDFPPNLEDLLIEHVVLAFMRAKTATFVVTASLLTFPGSAGSPPLSANTVNGVISTRTGSWAALIDNKTPFGDWKLALPTDPVTKALFTNEEIEDILLVITYSGRTADWPA